MKHGLVVDHSTAIRKIARRILECFEFEIVETGDTTDGLKSCRREMPDLILVDLHMPDAIEFIAAVRRMLKGRIPKVVSCSMCAEHDRQLGGESPLPSLMVAKG